MTYHPRMQPDDTRLVIYVVYGEDQDVREIFRLTADGKGIISTDIFEVATAGFEPVRMEEAE